MCRLNSSIYLNNISQFLFKKPEIYIVNILLGDQNHDIQYIFQVFSQITAHEININIMHSQIYAQLYVLIQYIVLYIAESFWITVIYVYC